MEKAMGALDITDPNYSSNYDEKKPPADGAPAEDGSDSEDEGDMSTSVLLDSVTKGGLALFCALRATRGV